jgi:hypothetical protein
MFDIRAKCVTCKKEHEIDQFNTCYKCSKAVCKSCTMIINGKKMCAKCVKKETRPSAET